MKKRCLPKRQMKEYPQGENASLAATTEQARTEDEFEPAYSHRNLDAMKLELCPTQPESPAYTERLAVRFLK